MNAIALLRERVAAQRPGEGSQALWAALIRHRLRRRHLLPQAGEGKKKRRRYEIALSCFLCLEKISHAAMNIAAITGPMTKPLSPNASIPPSVEISTT